MICRDGIAFATLPIDAWTKFQRSRKGWFKTYALDDSFSFIGAVAAGFHRRRWRKFNSLAFTRGFGGFGSSVDYRKTGRRLTQLTERVNNLRS